MENSIFTKASFLDENSGQRALSATEKDPHNPENIPDIELMIVSLLSHDRYNTQKLCSSRERSVTSALQDSTNLREA